MLLVREADLKYSRFTAAAGFILDKSAFDASSGFK
jgi:hypothetical protein